MLTIAILSRTIHIRLLIRNSTLHLCTWLCRVRNRNLQQSIKHYSPRVQRLLLYFANVGALIISRLCNNILQTRPTAFIWAWTLLLKNISNFLTALACHCQHCFQSNTNTQERLTVMLNIKMQNELYLPNSITSNRGLQRIWRIYQNTIMCNMNLNIFI